MDTFYFVIRRLNQDRRSITQLHLNRLVERNCVILNLIDPNGTIFAVSKQPHTIMCQRAIYNYATNGFVK
jgi:hypothetical protein